MGLNIIEEMLLVLEFVQDLKRRSEGRGKLKLRDEDVADSYRDIEAKLCELMSRMISTPLTGNIATACSREKITTAEAHKSFEASRAAAFPL